MVCSLTIAVQAKEVPVKVMSNLHVGPQKSLESYNGTFWFPEVSKNRLCILVFFGKALVF